MFKRDSFWLGISIGILSPVVFYGFLILVNLLLASIFGDDFLIRKNTMLLLSIFINLLPIRVYFVSWKLDKTGRGVLLVTFALIILFFVIIKPLR
jgi:hypothetical protein